MVEQTRRELGLEAPRERRRTVERLDRIEVERLIEAAYVHSSRYGFMVKILFYTGARVSEFVHLRVEDLHLAFDPPQVYIAKAKGGSDGYVPILPALVQELRTHLGGRRKGYVFESNRSDKYTTRYVQRLVKESARKSVVGRRMPFEINVDSRPPNSHLRLNPNVSVRQKPSSTEVGLLESYTSGIDPRLPGALLIPRTDDAACVGPSRHGLSIGELGRNGRDDRFARTKLGRGRKNCEVRFALRSGKWQTQQNADVIGSVARKGLGSGGKRLNGTDDPTRAWVPAKGGRY